MTPTDRPAAAKLGGGDAAGQHVGRCLHTGCGWHPKPHQAPWTAHAEHAELTGHSTVGTRVGR